MAAQTYRITSTVIVGDVLEGEPGCISEYWEGLSGHDLASIHAPERPGALLRVYALCAAAVGYPVRIDVAGAEEASLLAGNSPPRGWVSK